MPSASTVTVPSHAQEAPSTQRRPGVPYGAIATFLGTIVLGCGRFDYELLGSGVGTRFRSGDDPSLGGSGGAGATADSGVIDEGDAALSAAGSTAMDAA